VIVITKSEFTNEDSDPEILLSNIYKDKLASVNAILRAINLTTGIVAPLAAGTLMSLFNLYGTHTGTIISALCFALWNFGSCFVEYFLLRIIYNRIPELQNKTASEPSTEKKSSNPIAIIYSSWSIFIKQRALAIPGIAFAFLFLTVLGFDSITLGYTKSQKMSEIFIAFFQAIGSLSGIFGTIAFPFLHNRLKVFLPYIPVIGSAYQIICLLVCFVAIWLPGSPFVLSTQFLQTIDAAVNETNCHVSHGIVGSPFEKFIFEPSCHPYTSIIVFLSGMAISRFGNIFFCKITINFKFEKYIFQKWKIS
jgi:iron-regulated transporter 1